MKSALVEDRGAPGPRAGRRRPARHIVVSLLTLLTLNTSACASAPVTAPAAPGTPPKAAPLTPTATAQARQAGDGRVVTRPEVGAVDLCQPPNPAPATAAPWIRGDGSWDAAARPVVSGVVRWPQASYQVTLAGAERRLSTVDLPLGGTTGSFPVATLADPAFAYDTGHAPLGTQAITMTLQANPVSRDIPACLPSGAIGVLTNGVLLDSSLDSAGLDRVAHEVVDGCGGRPNEHGVYHYNTVTTCIPATAPIPAVSPDHAALAGYAFDGFGIFVERDAAGAQLTNHDLDACHGRISWVPWDGRIALMYHYVVTAEFPYTVGCFRGTGTGNAWDNHDPNS